MKSISLKQNVETRWGSVFAMLDSINQNKLCIISYFDKIIKNNNSKKDEELKKMLLNTNEWATIQSLITPLDSIDAVYKLMSGENYCTISFVYPTITQFLNNHLMPQENDLQEINEFKVRFRQEIELRFTPYDQTIAKSPALLASVLNPGFKDLSFVDKKIKKLAYNEIKEQMREIKSLRVTQEIQSDGDYNSEESDCDTQTSIPAEEVKLTALEKIFGKTSDSPKEI